jgi:hypothetical protein
LKLRTIKQLKHHFCIVLKISHCIIFCNFVIIVCSSLCHPKSVLQLMITSVNNTEILLALSSKKICVCVLCNIPNILNGIP